MLNYAHFRASFFSILPLKSVKSAYLEALYCFHQLYGTVDTGLSYYAGCTEREVRLVEGVSRLEGRVEFCKDSQWGIICQTNWENQDARVVCRQLGYSVAGMTYE